MNVGIGALVTAIMALIAWIIKRFKK